jgi:hypothetical protein
LPLRLDTVKAIPVVAPLAEILYVRFAYHFLAAFTFVCRARRARM